MSSGNNNVDANRPHIKASDMDEELLVLFQFRKKSQNMPCKLSIHVSMKIKSPIS